MQPPVLHSCVTFILPVIIIIFIIVAIVSLIIRANFIIWARFSPAYLFYFHPIIATNEATSKLCLPPMPHM